MKTGEQLARRRRGRIGAWLISAVVALLGISRAQPPQSSPQTLPVVEASARAVTLDVVVTSKGGVPVNGLTAKDFSIFEDGIPQKIASFEAVDVHGVKTDSGEAPATVLVLDEMNTRFTDVVYARDALKRLFAVNNAQLYQPTTLLALTNQGLITICGYTRDGHTLAESLRKHQSALPYMLSQGFYGALDRISQTLNALGQIASSTQGTPTHKTIVWVSSGLPLLSELMLPPQDQDNLFRTIMRLSDQLMQSRVTLYTVDPRGTRGALANNNRFFNAYTGGAINMGDAAIGDVGLQTIAVQTGGKALFGDNDIDHAVAASLADADVYYTLLYYPTNKNFNSRYRRIRVAVDQPGTAVLTRTGYYALPSPAIRTPAENLQRVDLAVGNPLPYNQLHVEVKDASLTRDPDTARVNLLIASSQLVWVPQPNGKLTATLDFAAADFSKVGKRMHAIQMRRAITLSTGLGLRQKGHVLGVPVQLPYSFSGGRLRFAVEDEGSGLIGTADVEDLTTLPVRKGTTPSLKHRPGKGDQPPS
ncbi:VWFA-related protein [Acidipila rosea]|uniref:VWFA-related protein n=1 Tax=Acidipila rosea TaxID=768535 RepID=A0A4R1KYY5_9BACT|nr:VWFA-related protein [Acidipila rosea]